MIECRVSKEVARRGRRKDHVNDVQEGSLVSCKGITFSMREAHGLHQLDGARYQLTEILISITTYCKRYTARQWNKQGVVDVGAGDTHTQ